MTLSNHIAIGLMLEVKLGKMLQTEKDAQNDLLRPYLRAAHIQPGGQLDLNVDMKEMWFSDREVRELDLRPGDGVIVEGGAGFGRAAYLENGLDGWGFQNSIIRLRGLPANVRYAVYALGAALEAGEIALACNAATFAHFTAEKVQRFRIPFHGAEEHARIVDYLDRETAEIDAMLAKMNSLSEALAERKILVIQNLTQRSDSGERWTAVPTAHLFSSIGSGTTPKGVHYYAESGSGIPWVTTSELRESVIVETIQDVTEEAVGALSALRVHPRGSVVIAMYGATIGRLAMLGVDAVMNQACCAFSSPRNVDSRFFYYALWGQREELILEANGGGQPNISQGFLRRWRVPCPPLVEQRRIADHLDEVTGRIDAMLATIDELKPLLVERRAALITDVVTGRKKVPA